MRLFLALAFISTLFLGGCGKNAPGLYVGEKEKTFDELRDADPLLIINGKKFTKKDLVNQVESTIQLAQKKRRYSENQIKKIRDRLLKGGTESYLRSALLCSYASRNRVVPTPEERSRFQSAFKKQYARKDRDLDSFFTSFPEEGKILREMFERDLTLSVLKNRFLADQFKVSDSEVDSVLKKINEINRVASSSNTLIYAHATNVWNRLNAGEDFAKLADIFSETEYKDPGGNWGTFSETELSHDPDLLTALKGMKEGAFTAPVEADGGLAIVKLIKSKMGKANSEISVFQFQKSYQLAYIFFKLPLFYEVPTRDEVRRVERSKKENGIYKKLLPKLLEHNRVDYPNGKNFFPTQSRLRRSGK